MESEPRRDASALLLVLATGILIPIVAAAIPSLLDRFGAAGALEFEYHGPIKVGETIAIEFVISNHGAATEDGVQLALPASLNDISAHSSSMDVNMDKVNGTTVLKIERLRGGEQATVALLAKYPYGTPSDYELQKLKIVSDTHVGTYGGPSEFGVFAREAAPWGFALLFGFLVFGGIYFEYFEPKKAKEARLLKELEKL